jgi:S-adenosylhomocysteine hydrolase
MIEESIVRDPTLAPEGHRKIDWVAQHAPVLNTIFEERLSDGALRERKVAMTIHLEAKTPTWRYCSRRRGPTSPSPGATRSRPRTTSAPPWPSGG